MTEMKKMSMTDLDYLKAMVEIRYRPKIMREKDVNDFTANLSLLAIFASQILVLTFYIRFEVFMLVIYLVTFLGSIHTYISSKRLEKKISDYIEVIQNIENAKDPDDLDKIDISKYGLGEQR